MSDIKLKAKCLLKTVAEGERAGNIGYMNGTSDTRTTFFWNVNVAAKKCGIERIEIEAVVRYLSERGFVYWRHYPRSVEVSDQGLHWEKYEELLDKPSWSQQLAMAEEKDKEDRRRHPFKYFLRSPLGIVIVAVSAVLLFLATFYDSVSKLQELAGKLASWLS